MISVIVCSRRSDVMNQVKDNVAYTIGEVSCEWIIIDNSKKKYNIFQAYNEGARRAKGDILCFMHDDVLFRSTNWGRYVEKAFEEDDKAGCIGVVGTHFLPNTPCGWYHSMVCSGGCIQNTGGNRQNLQDLTHFCDHDLIEAVAVDGMWLCIPKRLFDKGVIRFDEGLFNGFHCYDLDICMQIRAIGLKVLITSKILIEHSSYGSFDLSWWKETQKLYQKWQHSLPQNVGVLITEEEKTVRTEMVNQVMVWLVAYANAKAEKERMSQSKAYRIGRTVLCPFRCFRKQ